MRAANRTRQRLGFLAVVFLLMVVLTKADVESWNDASRVAQIDSIVVRGTFVIDGAPFEEQTFDKYFFDGHFYSDKPPLLAVYSSAVYGVVRCFGVSFETNPRLTYYLVVLFSIGGLVTAGSYFTLRIFEEHLFASPEWARLAAFLAIAGTLMLPYSVALSNHAASGSLLAIGAFFLFGSRESPVWRTAMGGTLLSLAGAIDIACFVFLPVILIHVWRHSRKHAVAFILSSTAVVFVYCSLNLATSGSLLPPAMNSALWDYPGSRFGSGSLSGLARHSSLGSALTYGFHALLGSRGLFVHSPLIVFGFLGLRNLRTLPAGDARNLLLLLNLAAGTFVAGYLAASNNYSGNGFGIRWFATVMIPFCLGLAAMERRLREESPLRFLFVLIACLSLLLSVVGSVSPFSVGVGSQPPPGYPIAANIDTLLDGSRFSMARSLVGLAICLGAFVSFYRAFVASGSEAERGTLAN